MKHRFIVCIFCISCFLLTVERVCQLLFMMEPLTGFYKIEFEKMGVLMWIFFIITIAVVAIFGFMSKRLPKRAPRVDISFMIVCLFSAVCFAMSAVGTLMVGFTFKNMLGALLSLLAATFFTVYGLSGLLNYTIPKYIPLFAFGTWIYRLIVSFITYTGLADISENIYDILMLCSCLLFFVCVGKILSGVNFRKTVAFVFPIGLVTTLLCLVCTLPRCIVIFAGKTDLLHESASPNLCVLATGIFAAFFTFKLFSKNNLGKKKKGTPRLPIPSDDLQYIHNDDSNNK